MLTLPALHVLLDLATGRFPTASSLSRGEWIALLAVAESAAVAPHVDAMMLRAVRHGEGAALDPAVLALVRERAADSAAAAAAWLADLRAAGAALEAVGVVPIVLKGAAMVALGVIEAGERHMHDIDLLIPAERADESLRALRQCGFEEPAIDPLPGVDGRPRSDSRWRDPHIAFHVTGPFGTPIEVHAIASRVSGGAWSEIAPLAVAATLLDVRVLAPSVDRLRTMLNEHVFLSHLSDPRLLLRHVADLAALYRHGGAGVRDVSATGPKRYRAAERTLMRLASVRAAESSAVTAAQRLLLSRDGENAARVEQIWHVLEVLEVVAHDLRNRPGLLLRRVVPHPAYLAALYGIPHDEAGSLLTHVRRWRELGSGLGGSRRRQ